MRVYLAGSRPERGRRLTRLFGDESAEGLPGASPEKRLRLLSECWGIWLPPDWRRDALAVWEKEQAERMGIPRVEYFPP